MRIGAVLNAWSLDMYASALPLCYTHQDEEEDDQYGSGDNKEIQALIGVLL